MPSGKGISTLCVLPPTRHAARVPLDRNGLQILSRNQCLKLLATRFIGRIGLSRDALPTILPVNYRVVDDDVIYATGTGTKSLAAARHQVVAFEVDDADSEMEIGWSVVVVGIPRELDDRDLRREEARELGLHPWIGERAPFLYRLATDRISGRRLVARGMPPGTPDGAGPQPVRTPGARRRPAPAQSSAPGPSRR